MPVGPLLQRKGHLALPRQWGITSLNHLDLLTPPPMSIKKLPLLGLQDELPCNRLSPLCTVVWPQYKLDNDSQWPPEVSLQYQILTHLDNFCHPLGKWGEIPYVMVFWDLRSHPNLCSSCPSACMLLAHPQPRHPPPTPPHQLPRSPTH